MLEAIVAIIALTLTIAMFAIRERLLAWPAVIFWGIFGGYEFTQCVSYDWTEIRYYVFFASAVGMVFFCALAQFALREIDNKKTDEDEYVDEAADPDKEKYYDEQGEGADSPFFDESHDEDGFLRDEYIGRSSVPNKQKNRSRRR
jgi:hypothetical protein